MKLESNCNISIVYWYELAKLVCKKSDILSRANVFSTPIARKQLFLKLCTVLWSLFVLTYIKGPCGIHQGTISGAIGINLIRNKCSGTTILILHIAMCERGVYNYGFFKVSCSLTVGRSINVPDCMTMAADLCICDLAGLLCCPGGFWSDFLALFHWHAASPPCLVPYW